MFVVIVDILVKEGHENEYREAILRQGQNSRQNEAGCLRFDILQKPGEPRSFTLCEGYTDEATFHEVHRKTAHYADYSQTTTPWVESKSARFYTRLWPE
jgi:(4S)-4-hydroxy-5-phosphonooxypentane-2,3-dione isomerase